MKKAKWATEPSEEKRVKISADPASSDRQTIAWQFHRRDMEHAAWGWERLGHEAFSGLVVSHLSSFETMTWNELAKAAGGRKEGTNHHSISIAKCCRDAQKRLTELKMDDVDELFSLRLTAKWRLFGVKDGRVLRFLWCDQEHSVYPVKK